jgi:hypothetical protein
MKYANLILRPLLLSMLGLLPLSGCGGGGHGSAPSTGPTLTSITLAPANASIAAATTQQFTATGHYSDSSTQTLTAQVTWSATGVATISSTGLATAGASNGSATITATLGSVSGSTPLTVTGGTGPTLDSIAVTPANSSLIGGATQQFTATGTYSDNSTAVITNLVSWSATGPATIVASTGLATAVNTTGTATITASLGAVTGSTQLSVTAAPNSNIMQITVNGSLCNSQTSNGYFNKPCVSATICNPDGSACQTVTDLLLDTGSYGLRVFRSAIQNLTLAQTSSGSGALAECVQFADQSSLWGPVQVASVQLGNEPRVQVPIQVIDASFARAPASCGTPDTSPVIAGYTGILGVGPLAEDCGQGCVTDGTIGTYFSCTGTTCTGATASLANQVRNPVASLPVDNNGVLVQLPVVPTSGAPSVNGSLILGVGTQTNNARSGQFLFTTNGSGDFRTSFNGITDIGFADTGSNAIYFSTPQQTALPLCSGSFSAWYCPPAPAPFSATNISLSGPSQAVSFSIRNFTADFSNSSNDVFPQVGGPSNFGFDWGLPFFFGRNVFFGIKGTNAPGFGTGPFVAY